MRLLSQVNWHWESCICYPGLSRLVGPFPKISGCAGIERISRLINCQKATVNQPASFSDRIEQHGSSTQSHTLTPQRYLCHQWGESCRFQAKPSRKVSVTRGKYGMSLKPSIGRVTCDPGLEEARTRLFRTCWWTLFRGSELGSCNLYLKLGKARFRDPQAQNAAPISVSLF